MSSPLITRARPSPSRDITFLKELTLAPSRAHEFCGNARHSLALMVAQETQGPVFWIHPGWIPDQLNPDGVCRFIDPSRLIFVTPNRAEDLLWSVEEVLRAGIVPLVVADIPGFPSLTSVRRLHLAAETGTREGRERPIALLLTPADGGAQGCETRWHMAQDYKADAPAWHLERRRSRSLAPKAWHITRDQERFHLTRALLKADSTQNPEQRAQAKAVK
ncbi:ImuA family protein [Falsihalocynthiibacter sp. S25ZX9]|uniref:ImuA family protein n=1 Tax=Falsihalocynthiibacter sp. S25ZX9 TaxID=3240870 RepID=UPI00350FABC1